MEQSEQEKYVLGKWERAEACPRFANGYRSDPESWCISLGGRMFTRANVPDPHAKTEADAWTAAFDYTKQREEDIRQIECEITELGCTRFTITRDDLDTWAEEPDGTQDSEDAIRDRVLGAVASLCATCRTLARLEAIKADLTRGFHAGVCGSGKDGRI